MLLSPKFRRRPVPDNPPATALLTACRRSLSPLEVSLPASVLRDGRLGQWLRDERAEIDVHDLAELHTAIGVGIRPASITLHTDLLTTDDVARAIAGGGVGRLVIAHLDHISALSQRSYGPRLNVMLRMRESIRGIDASGFEFDSREADSAVDAIRSHRRCSLVGLHCDVGTVAAESVSIPSATGNLIAQTDHIRRSLGPILTRVSVGGSHFSAADFAANRMIANEIDESIDDACATLRFPRPAVVVALQAKQIERLAA